MATSARDPDAYPNPLRTARTRLRAVAKMEKGAEMISALRRVVRNRPWSYDVLVPF